MLHSKQFANTFLHLTLSFSQLPSFFPFHNALSNFPFRNIGLSPQILIPLPLLSTLQLIHATLTPALFLLLHSSPSALYEKKGACTFIYRITFSNLTSLTLLLFAFLGLLLLPLGIQQRAGTLLFLAAAATLTL